LKDNIGSKLQAGSGKEEIAEGESWLVRARIEEGKGVLC